MHTFATLFLIAIPLVAAVAIVIGDHDDRSVAGAMLAAFALTLGLRAIEAVRFGRISTGIMAVDVALVVIVSWIAIRTQRWWIILMASLLIFPVLGHFAKFVDPALSPGGYWLMTNAPALPCVLLLAVGAVQARRRKMNVAITSASCSAADLQPKSPPHG